MRIVYCWSTPTTFDSSLFMNDLTLFELALGLENPWFVSSSTFDVDIKRKPLLKGGTLSSGTPDTLYRGTCGTVYPGRGGTV